MCLLFQNFEIFQLQQIPSFHSILMNKAFEDFWKIHSKQETKNLYFFLKLYESKHLWSKRNINKNNFYDYERSCESFWRTGCFRNKLNVPIDSSFFRKLQCHLPWPQNSIRGHRTCNSCIRCTRKLKRSIQYQCPWLWYLKVTEVKIAFDFLWYFETYSAWHTVRSWSLEKHKLLSLIWCHLRVLLSPVVPEYLFSDHFCFLSFSMFMF